MLKMKIELPETKFKFRTDRRDGFYWLFSAPLDCTSEIYLMKNTISTGIGYNFK